MFSSLNIKNLNNLKRLFFFIEIAKVLLIQSESVLYKYIAQK